MWIISQIMFTGVTLCSITVAISGCIQKEEEEGMDENLTPSVTPFQTDSTVSPASRQLFIHPDSSETFQLREDIETIEINRSTKCQGNHCGYYATKDDIDYSIKPVVWRYNEACERIRSFDIWNSSKIHFEVHVIE